MKKLPPCSAISIPKADKHLQRDIDVGAGFQLPGDLDLAVFPKERKREQKPRDELGGYVPGD